MSGPLIDMVQTAPTGSPTDPGDDTIFVAVGAGRKIGWYGPVNADTGRAIETAAGLVVGTSPLDHHHLRPRLRAAAPTISDWAVGAIDCAIWDLCGHLAGQPVAALLGPTPSLAPIPAYASWLQQDLSDPDSELAIGQVGDSAWAFTKWGMRRRSEVDVEIQDEAMELAEALARAAGVLDRPFAVDAVGTWNAALALALAGIPDLPALAWIEDPLPNHQTNVYQRLAAAGLPVALGERLRPEENVGLLIDQARPAALTIDVVGCGGLTRAVEAVKISREVGLPVYPHGRSMVPGLHLAAAFPDAVPAVEYRLQWERRRQMHYAEPWTPVNGTLPAPHSPGLGTRPRSTR